MSQRDFSGSLQRFLGSVRRVTHFEVRVKSRKVQWNIRSQVFGKPSTQLIQFLVAIVLSGNQQSRDFNPHLRFLFEPQECLQNGL